LLIKHKNKIKRLIKYKRRVLELLNRNVEIGKRKLIITDSIFRVAFLSFI